MYNVVTYHLITQRTDGLSIVRRSQSYDIHAGSPTRLQSVERILEDHAVFGSMPKRSAAFR